MSFVVCEILFVYRENKEISNILPCSMTVSNYQCTPQQYSWSNCSSSVWEICTLLLLPFAQYPSRPSQSCNNDGRCQCREKRNMKVMNWRVSSRIEPVLGWVLLKVFRSIQEKVFNVGSQGGVIVPCHTM